MFTKESRKAKTILQKILKRFKSVRHDQTLRMSKIGVNKNDA